MDTLRAVLKFIGRHRILTLLAVVFVFFGLAATRVVVQRSQGVLSSPLKKGRLINAVYGIGTVTATHSYSIKQGVTQTILDQFVKEGDFVKKGDKLVNIDKITYRAPFDGVVNYLPFKQGENVFANMPLLVLTDLSDRYLVVNLEQQSALKVRVGQKAKISFDSMRQEHYEGIVKAVYSYNGNFLARIDISKLPPEIFPDMTADVAIEIEVHENALSIPVAAFEDGSVMVKRAGGLPRSVPVKLGIVDQTLAEIVSGDLHEGDQVIIRRKIIK